MERGGKKLVQRFFGIGSSVSARTTSQYGYFRSKDRLSGLDWDFHLYWIFDLTIAVFQMWIFVLVGCLDVAVLA